MDEIFNDSPQTLKVQIQAFKRMRMIFGMIFVACSLLLVIFISFSSQLFQDSQSQQQVLSKTTSYSDIDETSPLPLLLSTRNPNQSNVQVKGIEITKMDPHGELKSIKSRSSDHPFIYTLAKDLNDIIITTSWKLPSDNNDKYYIVYEHTTKGDIELFSTYGRNLEESTNSFNIDHRVDSLHLKVITVTDDGSRLTSLFSATASNAVNN